MLCRSSTERAHTSPFSPLTCRQNFNAPLTRSPYHLQCFSTLVYLSTANVYLLINYTAFNESLFITLSVAGLLWLRYKQPDLERPIKVNLILPIFFFVVCTFLVLLPVFEKPVETGISALITLTGIPVYLATIAWKNKPALYNKINGNLMKSIIGFPRTLIMNLPFNYGSLKSQRLICLSPSLPRRLDHTLPASSTDHDRRETIVAVFSQFDNSCKMVFKLLEHHSQ